MLSAAIEAEAAPALQNAPAPVRMLANVKSIGPEFAAVLWTEGFCRSFANRRQVAAYAGLAPTPWQSGSIDREQGVSKAGNPRLRTTMIQLAWLWLRHQPDSELTRWLHERQARQGARKTTIVRARPQAACRAVEIRDRRRRYRRSRHEGRRRFLRRSSLPTSSSPSAEARSASVDPGGRTDGLHGFKSRDEEWFRPPEPQPPNAESWC